MSSPLYMWTSQAIREQCGEAYNVYKREKTERAKAYFAEHPELRDPEHEYKAKNIAAALPPGWEGLAELIPPKLRHRHFRSGNSSQMLALALLGASRTLDPSHQWLWQAFGTLPSPAHQPPTGDIEVALEPDLLNEDPERVTSLDYRVVDEGLVMCIECKWTEAGIGACSCDRAGGDSAEGRCRAAVLKERPLYWATAKDVFFLPDRVDGKPCPLSAVYQAVRNVAAANALRPPDGLGVFGLIYDADNPYFKTCGEWPGWPAVLAEALDGHEKLRFRSTSWQQLIELMPLDDDIRAWAREKHGLG